MVSLSLTASHFQFSLYSQEFVEFIDKYPLLKWRVCITSVRLSQTVRGSYPAGELITVLWSVILDPELPSRRPQSLNNLWAPSVSDSWNKTMLKGLHSGQRTEPVRTERLSVQITEHFKNTDRFGWNWANPSGHDHMADSNWGVKGMSEMWPYLTSSSELHCTKS